MNLRAPLAFLVVAALSLSACKSNDSPTAPSANVAYAQTDLRVGTGAEAVLGRNITVHYTGWFYSATGADNKGGVFQTTAGSAPVTFALAQGNLIAGWVRGIPGMRVGGIRRLVLPPDMAYGSTGTTGIPPNSTLVFEVELVAVQ